MFSRSFPRATIVATLCLTALVSGAVSHDDHTVTTEASHATSRRAGQPTDVHGNVMKACGSHISLCGVEDEDNVILVPKTTITKTNNITSTSIKRLKPTTSVIVEISVLTVTDTTKGHCRKTVIAAGPPAEVTVDVTIVAVQEIQKVERITTVSVVTTTASVVEQCFLEKHNGLGHMPEYRGPESSRVVTPHLSSTQTASPAGFTADFDQPSHDSTPNDMEGGLHGQGVYEQGSDE
ncbi:hypothetical protein FVEN_g13066 [Fusarium venenatum]|uniref:Uncharacterized protein n=1 Tax=Fusarium venenatum TaxID=56646 RepID=A0A2L2TBK8_9HYPO|nr:uncharacterized protein FVRRES_03960 [Fusarium venenatum]KAG8350227.1 hypothetical protein FVEN_g13066 [Fusarium venenatum]KAH7003068.1 hypothetical protein EDB82DRAFT_469893 [Fusarium venenatum]CEI67448.1 unnamed protein product [Fusarium venenatum]